MAGFNLGILAIPAVILVSIFIILPVGLIVTKIADRDPNSILSRNRDGFIIGILFGLCLLMFIIVGLVGLFIH